MIKAAVLVVLTALCCWILFRSTLRVESVHRTEIGAYVKHSYEALRAIEEIAVRRGIGVSTALREGVITIQIQEQDLRIWIKIE